ncbi:MAG: tRNA (guanosine(37)-N1)-methyltransferase TrmD [Pseudomonadota bacterium]
MRIAIVSLFPELIRSLCEHGVIGRAIDQGLVPVQTFDPRDFTKDKHRSVDDRPFGGGPGMVMRPPPLVDAILAGKSLVGEGARVVYMSPQGQAFNRDKAVELAGLPGLVVVAGRYEGIDERVIDGWVDEEVSVGDYVVSGGELPAALLLDAVLRHVPGIVGRSESVAQDSFEEGMLDYPHYTRPDNFLGRDVPDVLLSGDHAAIERWRRMQALKRTRDRRPDLFRALLTDGALSDDDLRLLDEN